MKKSLPTFFPALAGPHPRELPLRRSRTRYPRGGPRARFSLVAAAVAGGCLAAIVFVSAQTPAKRTTLDKVYTKEQAAKGEAQYLKVCASCHDPAKVPAGKKPAPAVSGEKFLGKWTDKPVAELITLVATTMPDDGSVVLTDAEATDLVAYILKLNTFPDGTSALPSGKPAEDIIIVKPRGGHPLLQRPSRRP